MKLEQLHVFGFGTLTDVRLGPLHDGVNLVTGPNEAGKSTVRDFLRALLFGFETGRNARRREPLRGGRHGGRVVLVTDEGRRLTLTLEAGTKAAGQRTVMDEHGSELSEEEITALVGGISRRYYENVHAFGIEELQQAATLTGPEMTDYLFGAATGDRPDQLHRTRKRLADDMLRLWRPRGRCAILDAREQLDHVRVSLRDRLDEQTAADSLDGNIATHRSRIAEHERRLADLETDRERLDRRLGLEAQWDAVRRLEQELADAPDATVDEETERRHAELVHERMLADEALATARARFTRAKSAEEHLEPDSAVLKNAETIEGLLAARSEITALRTKRDERAGVFGTHEAALWESLDALGPGWTEVRANLERDLEAIDDALEEWSSRLLAARITSEDGRPHRPTHVRDMLAGAVAVAVGLGSGFLPALGLMTRPTWLGVAGVLAGAGLVFIGFGLKRRAEWNRDEKTRSALAAEWNRWLKRHELERSSRPAEVRTLVRRLRQYDAKRKELEERRAWLERADEEIATFEKDVHALYASLSSGDEAPHRDAFSLLSDMAVRLDESRRANVSWRQLHDESRHQEDDVTRLIARVEQIDLELCAIRDTVGVVDETSFDIRVDESRTRRQLEHDVRTLRAQLSAAAPIRTGAEAATAAFDPNDAPAPGSLAGVDPEEEADLLAERASLARAIEEETAVVNALREDVGGLSTQLDALQTTRDVSGLKWEEARLAADLSGAMANWSVLALASHLVEQAADRFQQENQPAVMRQASHFFRLITDGAYERILRPADKEGAPFLCERRVDGHTLSPDELSRGTREALFLAIRFAVVRESRHTRPALPVVLDDVLVDLDPARMRGALTAVQDLAQTHQVFLFTCHEHIAEAARSSGEVAEIRL